MDFWEEPRNWRDGEYTGPRGDFFDGDTGYVIHVDPKGKATRRTMAAHRRWDIARQTRLPRGEMSVRRPRAR